MFMLKQHVIRVQKDIRSLAIIHPDFISEDTASATSALSAEWIKKTIQHLAQGWHSSLCPLPKRVQEIRGSTWDRKKRNSKSETLGRWSTLKAQEKKRSLDASRGQEQIEEGTGPYRMDDLSTGKGTWETHTTPTSYGKNAEDYWAT